MIRGTTPTVKFWLPCDVALLKNVFISFSQNKNVLINYTLKDCSVEGNIVIVKMSQEETLRLRDRYPLEIQVRAITNADEAIASNIVTTSVDRILYDGVIQ